MKQIIIFILALLFNLYYSNAQIDAALSVSENTIKHKRYYTTEIFFEVTINNQNDFEIYFPYNAVTQNNFECAPCVYRNKINRYYQNSISDTEGVFTRIPEKIPLLPDCFGQRYMSSYLNLNYQGHPRGTSSFDMDCSDVSSYIDSISYITIQPLSAYKISFVFSFHTKKNKFTDFFKDSNLIVKLVFFEQGIEYNSLINSHVYQTLTDSVNQPYIVEQYYEVNFGAADSIKSSLISEKDKLEELKSNDRNLLMYYILGGW